MVTWSTHGAGRLGVLAGESQGLLGGSSLQEQGPRPDRGHAQIEAMPRLRPPQWKTLTSKSQGLLL